MFIVPINNNISAVDNLTSLDFNKKVEEKDNLQGSEASFTDIFKQAVQNVEETRKVAEEDAIKVALGEVDDLHTIQINLEKAATAIDVLVTMKNTAIDSYNEIMRMGI